MWQEQRFLTMHVKHCTVPLDRAHIRCGYVVVAAAKTTIVIKEVSYGV